MSFDESIKENPVLSAEDIRSAIAYGAKMTRERIVDIKPDVKAACFLLKKMVYGKIRVLVENEVKCKSWIVEQGRERIHKPV